MTVLSFKLDYWNSDDVSFSTIPLQVSTTAKWTSTHPVSAAGQSGLHIWHYLAPLKSSRSRRTEKIIQHIEDELEQWLQSDAFQPVKIPRRFMLVDQAIDAQTFRKCHRPIQEKALGLICSYVVQVAEEQHAVRRGVNAGSHLQWVDGEDAAPSYPEPVFTFPSSHTTTKHQMAALLLLMRSPQYHDGGADYMFERYMNPVMNMLFGQTRTFFLPQTDSTSSTVNNHCPIIEPVLVAGGCTDFSDEIRTKMAAAVQPTLERMIHEARNGDSLLQFNFVYGIHWSTSCVRILIHFPCFNEGSDEWEFRQVVAAEHYIGCSRKPESKLGSMVHEDDMFLYRWRLAIALFAVRSHVDQLETWLHPDTLYTPDIVDQMGNYTHSVLHYVDSVPHLDLLRREKPRSRMKLHERSVAQYIQEMRGIWTNGRYAVPEEWLPPCPFLNTQAHIAMPESGKMVRTPENIISQKVHLLSMCYLYAISEFLQPLSLDEIMRNHEQETLFPDYILQPHLPRIGFFHLPSSRGMWIDRLEARIDTTNHLMKLHDIMSMQVATWHDVNIYVANVFSGFASYGVRWKPCFVPNDVSHIVLDFALAVQTIPPTSEKTMRRTLHMPSTVLSPFVLLGLREEPMDDAGSVVTSRDKQALRGLVAPHICILEKHFQHLSSTVQHDVVDTPPPILFCTYLKAGYLHIIAILPLDRSNRRLRIITVDSIPIAMESRGPEDYLDRMRLLMALFTLQRHVVRFSKLSDDVIWPSDVLDEEYSQAAQFGLYIVASSTDSESDAKDTRWHCHPPPKSLSEYTIRESGEESDYDEDVNSDEDGDGDLDMEDAEADVRHEKVSWAWLKRFYERYDEPELLENMSRVEAWVEDYDPWTVAYSGEPVP